MKKLALAALITLGLAATHDIALSELEHERVGQVTNVHFTDVMDGDEMIFDYRLRDGVVKTSNALRLLGMAGIAVPDDELGRLGARFNALLDAWGGVTVAYRRTLHESPAYRLNHEEVEKSLEEGVHYIEHMAPKAERFALKAQKLFPTDKVRTDMLCSIRCRAV